MGDTTSPARRFEALGEAVDTLVARVAILRGGVMAAARRRVGFPLANESTGITGNPHSYMRARWWELLRRPFDVQPYLSLGLGNDTMQVRAWPGRRVPCVHGRVRSRRPGVGCSESYMVPGRVGWVVAAPCGHRRTCACMLLLA